MGAQPVRSGDSTGDEAFDRVRQISLDELEPDQLLGRLSGLRSGGSDVAFGHRGDDIGRSSPRCCAGGHDRPRVEDRGELIGIESQRMSADSLCRLVDRCRIDVDAA